MMTDNQKFVAGAILGAAAGAAAAFFLTSDKGKDLVSHVKDLAGDSYDKVKTKANEWTEHLKNEVNEAKEKAQQQMV